MASDPVIGSDATVEPIGTWPWLSLPQLVGCFGQLAVDSSPSQATHEVARFILSRDWRAACLAASSLAGTWSPARKCISSGVWSRTLNVEDGCYGHSRRT